MTESTDRKSEVTVDVTTIPIRRKSSGIIAVIGNPNSGKSTLFNRLTGLSQTTGNYPGVTVERHVGRAQLDGRAIDLIDLPGVFCLSGGSADERIAVDVLMDRIAGEEGPGGLLFVLDATHLYQGLYLLEQLLEIQLPTVVALTMTDMASAAGLDVDIDKLSAHLGGLPVCPVIATESRGLAALKSHLERLEEFVPEPWPRSWPEFSRAGEDLAGRVGGQTARIDALQGLLHPGSEADMRLNSLVGESEVAAIRQSLFGDQPPQAMEARRRYTWVRDVMQDVQSRSPVINRIGNRLSHAMNQPWPATIGFFVLMGLVFQAVFSWATPLMDAIDAAAGALAGAVSASFGQSAFASFLGDGVIAGVGSVIVFLPQISILFLFLIVLEDSGYLARAAFLMDRVMRTVGLSGQSVIPMLSSFACAVPAIMATRVIPDRRDRIATILAAPFMTCSARLPIYALLIAAFVPREDVGWFNLQGLVLFGLYLLGIAGGLATAWALKKSALRGPKPAFSLALPQFRWPNLQTVLIKLLGRISVFIKRAGTVIFTVAVIVWVLAYYPRMEPPQGATGEKPTMEQENDLAAAQMAQSWLGRAGRAIEPAFEPLGWDWRVTAAVIAGFPAREVVVAVMGTLYSVGAEADDARLSERLHAAKWPDGRLVFTLPMVLGLMVFYAWCLQCAATVATIRRETNSWRWPLFAWAYMTILGYTGALVIYQAGSLM